MIGLSILRSRWLWINLSILLIAGGVWGWCERTRLMAWYHVNQLTKASDDQVSSPLQALAELDDAPIAPLVERLKTNQERVCTRCGWALGKLVFQWGANHPNLQKLAAKLEEDFLVLSPLGRLQAFAILDAILLVHREETLSDSIMQPLGGILAAEARTREESLLPAALQVANRLTYRSQPVPAEIVQSCRALVHAAIADPRPQCRLGAIRLASADPVGQLFQIVPLVMGNPPDPAPEVRALALVAIGGPEHEDLVSTDDLIPLLHDSDLAVRQTCAKALASRGLSEFEVQLAARMTHPDPAIRAQVPSQVFDFPNLDAKQWLQRLSSDPAPAVRAAMVRAAAEFGALGLRERLWEITQSDPNPTVRQLAEYYLKQPVPPFDR